MNINCIAIDDEPLALSLLKKFIQKIPYLNLVENFESAFDAVEMLKMQKIDLIFLDINMPDLNGIQFIKNLAFPPMVIFTTAHSKYALESYELNTIDYLLKPFSFDRFLKAVDKAHSFNLLKVNNLNNLNLQAKTSNEEQTSADYIFVKSDYQFVKIKLSEILYIETDKDYLKIHIENQKTPILTLGTLKAMAESLDYQEFVRIHRAYIVAVSKIKSIRKGRLKINDTELPIGEMYTESFFKLLGLENN